MSLKKRHNVLYSSLSTKKEAFIALSEAGNLLVRWQLYVVEGYNHQEIASMLDISEGTSKSNLFKARAKLQKKMQRVDQSCYGRKGI